MYDFVMASLRHAIYAKSAISKWQNGEQIGVGMTNIYLLYNSNHLSHLDKNTKKQKHDFESRHIRTTKENWHF